KRKYTGEPYINHTVAVAQIVASVTDGCAVIAAAFLHDAIEDTDRTYQDIFDAGFRHPVADIVLEVSDVSRPEDGNRATRKALDRDHLAKASPDGQTLKLADLINNTESICKYDPGFAVIYMREKLQLLEVLTKGDKTLHARALKLVEDFFKK
ncbi:MAG: HD domain-containing protein, partial [Candidatus Odinarchaeia archaeon]